MGTRESVTIPQLSPPTPARKKSVGAAFIAGDRVEGDKTDATFSSPTSNKKTSQCLWFSCQVRREWNSLPHPQPKDEKWCWTFLLYCSSREDQVNQMAIYNVVYMDGGKEKGKDPFFYLWNIKNAATNFLLTYPASLPNDKQMAISNPGSYTRWEGLLHLFIGQDYLFTLGFGLIAHVKLLLMVGDVLFSGLLLHLRYNVFLCCFWVFFQKFYCKIEDFSTTFQKDIIIILNDFVSCNVNSGGRVVWKECIAIRNF